MPAPSASPVLSCPPAREEREQFHYVSSYKCEACGKIIAAPGEKPPPDCCEVPMMKIR